MVLLYFGFEDERLAGMTIADLGIIMEEYYRLHPEWREGHRPVFFLDEIQTISGWEGLHPSFIGNRENGFVSIRILCPAAVPGSGDKHAR